MKKYKISNLIVFYLLLCFCCIMGMQIKENKAFAAGNTYEVKVSAGSTAKEIQNLLDINSYGTYDELILTFPRGNYYLDRTLYVYSNTTIKADKKACFYKQRAYGAMLEGKLNNDRGGYNGCKNVIVEGGVWDTSALLNNVDGTETFRFIHSSNITIKDAEFAYVPEGSHFIVFAGTSDSLISGCNFHGYGNDGDGEIEPKEAIQLDVTHDGDMVPSLQEVKWDDLPCKNITITKCNFSDYPRAIGSHLAVQGIFHDGIVISDNVITGMTEEAIKLYNYKNTTVSGNTITDCVEGVIVYTELNNANDGDLKKPLNGEVSAYPSDYAIVIENNIIKNMKMLDGVYGDGIRISGSAKFPISGVKVKNNQIYNAERYGIFATETSKVTINGNQINSTGKHAILIEENSLSSEIATNKIESAGESGIAVYTGSHNATVSGNIISKSQGDGIYFYKVSGCYAGSSKSKSAANTITDVKGTGIYVTTECTNTIAQNNVITNAKEHGVWVYNSQKITLDGNTISAGEYGINVNTESKNAVVKNNVVISAGKIGIWLSGSECGTISGNEIKKYAANSETADNCGIYVYQSGGTESKRTIIENNLIEETGKAESDAIRVSTSDFTDVSSNEIKKALRSGIYVYESKKCNISANKMADTKGSGLYITTNCENTVAENNIITNAGEHGIWVYKSKNVELHANTISATEHGININTESEAPLVKNNIITSAGKIGIWVSGSKYGTIFGNEIKKYAVNSEAADNCGIYVYQSGGSEGKPTVIANNLIEEAGKAISDAIRVSTSDFTDVKVNVIKKALRSGIYVYKSKGCNIFLNKVSNVAKNGIYATTACENTTIKRNTVINPEDTAIMIYQADNSFVQDNNVKTSSKLAGIRISQSNNSEVTSNTISGALKGKEVWITSSEKCKTDKNRIK